jgi:glycosyltransferase involved in cell wall biosynthesis
MWSIYWLRKTLREADLVTYPSERLHIFHTALSGVKHTAEIIPHVGFASIAPVQQEGFTLLHAGRMAINGDTGRTTDALLKGLVRFLKKQPTARSETKLIFVGPEDRETQRLIEELGLKENVISTGVVSYQESLHKIGEASVCILLEARLEEGIYLPSKLVDYIVARRPVLAISPQVGVVNDMASAGGILRVDPDDDIGVELALVKLYRDCKNGCLNLNAPAQNLVSQFQPQTVAKKFLAAVSNVIGHC